MIIWGYFIPMSGIMGPYLSLVFGAHLVINTLPVWGHRFGRLEQKHGYEARGDYACPDKKVTRKATRFSPLRVFTSRVVVIIVCLSLRWLFFTDSTIVKHHFLPAFREGLCCFFSKHQASANLRTWWWNVSLDVFVCHSFKRPLNMA